MVSPQIKRKMIEMHYKVNNNNIPGMLKSSCPDNGSTDGSGNRTLLRRVESQPAEQLKLDNNNTILCAKTMMMDALARVNSLDDDGMSNAESRQTSRINTDETSEKRKPTRTISDETSRDDTTILCAKTMMIEALARVNISDDNKSSLYETNTDPMVEDPRITSLDEITRDNTTGNGGGKIVLGTFERKSSVGKTIIIRATTKVTGSKEKKTLLNNNINTKRTFETVGNSLPHTNTVKSTKNRLSSNDKAGSPRIASYSRDDTTARDHKIVRAANTKETFGREVSDRGNINKNDNNNNSHNNHYNTLRNGKDTITKGRLWKKISSEWDYNNNNNDEEEDIISNPKKISIFSVTSEDGYTREDDDEDEEEEIEGDGIASRRALPVWMQEAQGNLT